jgi:hypothetical protein
MTATNHALTGALIGLVIGEPLIAIPAALASHFVCDALPHYSSSLPEEKLHKSKGFRNYLIAEASLCFLIVLVLAIVRPENWLLACVCAFTATSPDLLWIPKYMKRRVGKKWQPGHFSKFAVRIQWFTKPIGAVVEIVWFVGCIILILPFLRAA